MEYITARRSETLLNEPYEITYADIRRMYYENLRDAEECRRVTESSRRGETYYANDGRPGEEKIADFHSAFFKEVLYRDMKTAGFMMQYPHGIVIRQGERNSYYRGENQIFPRSQPSLYRSLEKFSSEKERQLYRLIADMKIAEFGIFICRLGITQFWLNNYGSVLFEPLAQHYGLETEWLDITNDFNIALFFATCAWDGKQWYPLTKADTEGDYSRQYGVLFHIPQWQAKGQSMMDGLEVEGKEKYIHNSILPIGFQPFMRCHSQYAYGIHMKEPYPLQNDFTFEKLYFRHNEKLSKDVFEMMDGGKKVYPQEGLDEFQDVIQEIRNASVFSEEAFQYAFEKNNYFKDADVVQKELREDQILGIPIRIDANKHPFKVSRQRIRHLNMRYEGFSIEKAYGIQLRMRKTFMK